MWHQKILEASSIFSFYLQTSFQTILATNGDVSYAILIYGNFTGFNLFEDYLSGFEAGNRRDGIRFNVRSDVPNQQILNDFFSRTVRSASDKSYVFRIDGEF